ncbi:hypothetical protein D3C75_841500 [compost metagenome]
MGDVGVAGEGLGLEKAVHEDLIRAGLGDQAMQLPLRIPAAQDQPPAARPQVRVQRPQALVQPPARGRADGPPLQPLVPHIDRQHRPPRRQGVMQGRVVGQPQVAAEPQDDGRRCGQAAS